MAAQTRRSAAARRPTRAAPPGWRLPPREEARTADGLTVLVCARGPLPLVSLRLVIQAGSAQDPAGKEGLADFTARLLRRGTKRLAAREIDDAVEFVGASLGTGVSEELFLVNITTPAEHLDAMLDVMGQLVREPTFPEEEVASARTRALAQLANDQDDPGMLADRALTRAYWGAHPYGHDPSGRPSTVRTFTREDVVRFHREQLGPKVALLTVVGAVEPQAVFRAAERAFAGWTGGPESRARAKATGGPALAGKVVVVDKPDQTQTQVRLAGRGFAFGGPDHFPCMVMNTALGGGFTSRLVNEIRVNRGLTYGIASYFEALQADGAFLVTTFTKTETTGKILKLTLAELKKMRQKGMTAGELAHAQTYLSGLYPLRTETNDSVAGTLAQVRLYGVDTDWVERYQERVRAVTLKEANAVAASYLFAQPPLVVLVGNAAALREQVAPFGEVQVLPATESE
jgi:zinc protease